MMFMQEVHFVSQSEIFSDITTFFHGDCDLFHGVKYFMVAVNFSWHEREISLTFQ